MSAVAIEHGSTWLRDLRHSAAAAFADLGVPTGKQEAWQYSNTTPLADLPFPVPPRRPNELHIADLTVPAAGSRVFLIDGYFFVEPGAGLPAGAQILSLAVAMKRDHPAARTLLGKLARPSARSLTALNTAMLDDGVLVDIGPGANLEQPIHIVHVTRAHTERTATHPRVLVRVGASARATVIESFVGSAPDSLDNAVTEVQLACNSALEHLRLHRACGTHVGATHVAADRDARYVLHAATMGTRLAREEIEVTLHGEGAHASIGGLLLGRDHNRVEHHVVVEHTAPSTSSDQLFKTIVDDHATGTFAGKVVVQSQAHGTSAQQTSRALLLSERARANAKPHLEIYTEDVRCTHGSTSGQLDEDALFYLRARGLDENEAGRLLTLAFAGEWLDRIRNAELRQSIDGSIREWLELSDRRTP